MRPESARRSRRRACICSASRQDSTTQKAGGGGASTAEQNAAPAQARSNDGVNVWIIRMVGVFVVKGVGRTIIGVGHVFILVS